MNVKIVKSKEDYAQAMARLSALMSLDPVAGSDDDNELGLLALVIADFEHRTVPPVQVAPIQPEPVAWMLNVDINNWQGQSEYRTVLAFRRDPVVTGNYEINEIISARPLIFKD
jgi:antitoxin component HigA of HigAB toxin-antitoxin module